MQAVGGRRPVSAAAAGLLVADLIERSLMLS
jgi:hypothetical protein